MSRRRSIHAGPALLLAIGAAPVLPAYAVADVLATQRVDLVETVTLGDGSSEVTYRPAETVTPGSELRYTVAYQNTSQDLVDDVQVVMLVPGPVVPIAGTAVPDGTALTYSVDGGASYGALSELTLTEGAQTRPAELSDVTHMRWTLPAPLQGDESGEVSYHAILR